MARKPTHVASAEIPCPELFEFLELCDWKYSYAKITIRPPFIHGDVTGSYKEAPGIEADSKRKREACVQSALVIRESRADSSAWSKLDLQHTEQPESAIRGCRSGAAVAAATGVAEEAFAGTEADGEVAEEEASNPATAHQHKF